MHLYMLAYMSMHKLLANVSSMIQHNEAMDIRSKPTFVPRRHHLLFARILVPCAYMQRQRQETNRQAMEGKDAKCTIKRHKADKHNRHGKRRNKDASKQKVVSARDKCRFELNVHSFIVLKHGQRTSKQDSCMDM